MEFQLTFTGIPTNGNPAHVNACDITVFFNVNNVTIFNTTTSGWACCFNIPLGGFPANWMIVRFQQIPSGAGGTLTWEAWDINGVRQFSHTETYTGTSGSHSNGANVGTTGENASWGFFRLYNTTVPLGSAEPTFADRGNLLEWKFDGTLADASGNGYTATSSAGSPANPCGSTPCYEPTSGQGLVTAVIKTNPAATWGNISWRAGTTVGLDCSSSISMGDSSGTPSCFWQILSGPSTPVWSSHTATRPTLTGIVFGNYRVQLVATGAGVGSATATADIGAVATDSNGVVISADPNVAAIFGPQIAFGQNPWGWEDERDLKAITSQISYQEANYDRTWQTPGQGTVSYSFAGKGFAPGPACTTLASGILATDTSIAVSNASCLSLSSLPTWILIGTAYNNVEMVRICSASATSGAATLTVCYDGRGMSGNLVAYGGYYDTQRSTAWPSGTGVGEFRIQGTGTLFSTDANRPICPAGIPGPPGPVVYSAGTVTLAPGSTTVTGTGTTWTTGNGVITGDFIRVTATHASGAAFAFWAQIVTVTDATHLVINRPAPAGVDGTAFSYKITSQAMWLSLEFNAPDGHIARALFNGVGCETETAMFAVLSHDITGLGSTVMSGVKYSYKTFLSLYSTSGTTTSNFYGVGIAARNFYYRSGYGPALALANAIDEYAVRDPEIGDGFIGGTPLTLGGMAIGAMIDLTLNHSTALTWSNVEQFARTGSIGALACNATDTRDGGYLTSWLTLAANYDTNATNRAAFKTALGSVLARDQTCKRNASDGYSGAEVNSFSNSFAWIPSVALTLTNGSAAVTGSGFSPGMCAGNHSGTITVTNGASTATLVTGTLLGGIRIYITDTVSSPVYVGAFEYSNSGTAVQLAGVWPGASGTFSFMTENNSKQGWLTGIWTDNTDDLAHNQALEKGWACTYNSPTSLTLNRPWDAASGSGYHMSSYTIGTFGQQPFMFGVKTNQVNWGSKNDDPTIAAGYASILPQMGEWFNAYGNDSVNTKGTFYNTVFQLCSPPTLRAAGSFFSIHGWDGSSGQPGCGLSGVLGTSAERVNSAEGGAAMIQYYLANPSPARKASVDTFYGAIFGYLPYCAASVLSTCDGTTASQLSDGDLSGSKWTGFYFGMGGFFTNSWPAVRLGGVAPPDPRTLIETCNISSVVNAVKCRITLTKPDGSTVTNTCTSSPCPITADGRQGDHLLKVDYLSASDAVLNPGDPAPIRVN